MSRFTSTSPSGRITSTMLHALLLAFSPTVLAAPAPALDPSCAPGGNFDLTTWSLQTHKGSSFLPDIIPMSQLTSCSSGFTDASFFTAPTDGALVMRVPGSRESSGCVTTENSQHCRTELRELGPWSWDPQRARNRLRATLAVPVADESPRGTVIGQILADGSDGGKPVCELYYSNKGILTIGVGMTRAGGKQKFTKVGQVELGTKFSYELRYEGGKLRLGIGGAAGVEEGNMVEFDTFDLKGPKSYFKAGNYNQGHQPSEVRFYALKVEHAD